MPAVFVFYRLLILISVWYSHKFHLQVHKQNHREENKRHFNDLEHLNRWSFSSVLVGVSIRLHAGCLFHCSLVDHLVLDLQIPQQRQSFSLVNACAVYGSAWTENKGLHREKEVKERRRS